VHVQAVRRKVSGGRGVKTRVRASKETVARSALTRSASIFDAPGSAAPANIFDCEDAPATAATAEERHGDRQHRAGQAVALSELFAEAGSAPRQPLEQVSLDRDPLVVRGAQRVVALIRRAGVLTLRAARTARRLAGRALASARTIATAIATRARSVRAVGRSSSASRRGRIAAHLLTAHASRLTTRTALATLRRLIASRTHCRNRVQAIWAHRPRPGQRALELRSNGAAYAARAAAARPRLPVWPRLRRPRLAVATGVPGRRVAAVLALAIGALSTVGVVTRLAGDGRTQNAAAPPPSPQRPQPRLTDPRPVALPPPSAHRRSAKPKAARSNKPRRRKPPLRYRNDDRRRAQGAPQTQAPAAPATPAVPAPVPAPAPSPPANPSAPPAGPEPVPDGSPPEFF